MKVYLDNNTVVIPDGYMIVAKGFTKLGDRYYDAYDLRWCDALPDNSVEYYTLVIRSEPEKQYFAPVKMPNEFITGEFNLISAIKWLRTITGWGLKDSKVAMEQLRDAITAHARRELIAQLPKK